MHLTNHQPLVPFTASVDEPGSLPHFGRILRRHILSVLILCVLGIAAGMLVTKLLTPMYQARATLEIQSLNDNFLNMRHIDPTAPSSNANAMDSYIQTQVEILQSESLTERVLGELHMFEDRGAVRPARFVNIRALLGASSTSAMSPKDSAIRSSLAQLKVRPARQASIVEILYESSDPVQAAEFTNTLAKDFIEQNLQARWQSTQQTGEYLTAQLTDLKRSLEKSEKDLQDYNHSAGLQFTAERNSVAEQKLRQLQEELSRIQADRFAKQSQYEIAMAKTPESLPAVLDNGPLREYQLKLAEIRRQMAEQSSLLSPTHYKVQRLQAQISELESILEKERANVVSRIRNDYEAAKAREGMLRKAYLDQTELVSGQANKAIRYDTLKNEVDSNRVMYSETLRKVKEASVISAMRTSNIRVIDPARAPSVPIRPDPILNAGLGFSGGLILAFCFILVRESTDRSFRLPGNAPDFLGVPELGVVPSAAPRYSKLLQPAQRSPGLLNLSSDTSTKRTKGLVERVAWDDPTSQVASSFRAVMTSILFSRHNGAVPKVIVVSSSQPREGKTTVVCNLGITLAQIGKRVLLIDGDSQRPQLHRIFKVSNASGLGNQLNETEPLRRSMVHETDIPGLFVLPSGEYQSHEYNMLYSKRLSELIAQARKDYDVVLIDTPPLLVMPDARVFGKFTDGILLVLRANQTDRETALATQQRIYGDQTTLLGTILNDWKSDVDAYKGY
jgi:succinoglycan biosynthesis transport protein ExoP